MIYLINGNDTTNYPSWMKNKNRLKLKYINKINKYFRKNLEDAKEEHEIILSL